MIDASFRVPAFLDLPLTQNGLEGALMQRVFLVGTISLLVLIGCDRVNHIERLTIENPTEFDLLVDVKAKDAPGAINLGVVKREQTATKQQVVDQGQHWVFRFRYLGNEVGEVSMSRSDLEDQDWRFRIPEEVGQRLQRQGAARSSR